MPGKSHTKKDRKPVIKKLTDLLKDEKVSEFVSKHKFRGPLAVPYLENQYDEAQYLSWHFTKTNELKRFVKYKEIYSRC